jgi:uncharacterized protein (TIGR03437 family)
MSSLKVFVLLLCCLPVFGQVVYTEITTPPALVATQVSSISLGTDGWIWMFLPNGTSGTGSLYRSDGTSTSLVGNINGAVFTAGAGRTSADFALANIPSPQGKDNLMSWNNPNPGILTIGQVTNGVLKTVCSGYTVDGGKGTLPQHLTRGPFPNYDGTYTVVGSTITKSGSTYSNSSTLFELVLAPNSVTTTCDLRTVVTVSNNEIVQAAKQPNGKHLVNQVDNLPNTRIGLLGTDGSYTDVVSTSNPKFSAARCCYFSQDWGTANAAIAEFGSDGKSHGLSYVNGVLSEVFNSGVTGQLGVDIWTNDFNGNFASFGGSNRTVGAADELILTNIASSKSTVIGAYNSAINGVTGYAMERGMATLDQYGTVYFHAYNTVDKTSHKFKAEISTPPKIDSFAVDTSTIVVGGATMMSWHISGTVTSVAVLGLGVAGGVGILPTNSGSMPISPPQTTTYFMTASGPQGIDKAQVTVTVVNNLPTPQISTNGIRNAASFDPSLSPGSFGSIFGQNLAPASVPASGLASGLPYLTSLSGVQVLVNGSPVPVQFVSAGQINFLVPFNTALGNATVQVVVNGVTGNNQTVPVSATSPGLFQYVVQGVSFGIATDQSNHLITADNPYTRGQYGTLWATGLGKLDPACSPQSVEVPSTGACNTIANVSLSIDGVPAVVGYAGTTPGFPGLYQVNFQVPTDASQVPYAAKTVLGTLVVGDKQTSFNIMSQQVVQ